MTDDLTILAERALLGAMLKHHPSVDDALDVGVTSADFHDDHSSAVFQACVDYRTENPGDKMDWQTIAVTAQTHKPLNLHDLSELVRGVVGVGNARYFALQVVEAAKLRRLDALSYRIHAAVEAGHDADTVEQVAANGLQEARGAHQAAGMTALRYQDLMAVQDSPDDWVVDDYLARGDRFVLTGYEGLGKSMLLRQAAVMTAAGLNFVTHKPMTAPRRVLVVDVENSAKQWRDRTRTMWQAVQRRGIDLGDRLHVACHGRIDVTNKTHLATLNRLVDQHRPDLFITGPLYKLTPKGINTDDDAAPVITALDGIRDRGVAMMVETHMGHATVGGPGSPRSPRPRGSAALLGWPEYGAGLLPVPTQTGEGFEKEFADMVHFRGQRDPRDWPQRWRHGSEWPWERWD